MYSINNYAIIIVTWSYSIIRIDTEEIMYLFGLKLDHEVLINVIINLVNI